MRLHTKYKQARKLLENGWPHVDMTGKHSQWFKVKDYLVRVEYRLREGKNGLEKWSCTCRFATMQGIAHGIDCSHILCCKAYLINFTQGKTFHRESSIPTS